MNVAMCSNIEITILIVPETPSFYHGVLSDVCSIEICLFTVRTKTPFSQKEGVEGKSNISPEFPSFSQVSTSPKSVLNFFLELQAQYLFRLCLFSSLFLFCFCFTETHKLCLYQEPVRTSKSRSVQRTSIHTVCICFILDQSSPVHDWFPPIYTTLIPSVSS